MKTPLFGVAVFLGVVLTVHLAMNAKVGAAIANPRVGNAFFWCVGAAMAVLIGISGWQSGALSGLKTVNPVLLLAGAIGSSLVFGIAWLIPQIGAGPYTIWSLAGQIIAGLVLSNFGWLGSPVSPVSVKSLIGAVLIVIGGVLATL
jgi:bacterial/archaeal transporter family-2 protein